MRQRLLLSLTSILFLVFSTGCIFVGVEKPTHIEPAIKVTTGGTAKASDLLVIWSSGDREVAMQSCLTYVESAVNNKWFNGTTLVITGPSARLLANDKDLQARIELIIDMGAKVWASADSASSFGVADKLKELGIDVRPIDAPLTDMLKAANTKVITF